MPYIHSGTFSVKVGNAEQSSGIEQSLSRLKRMPGSSAADGDQNHNHSDGGTGRPPAVSVLLPVERGQH